MQQCNSLSLSHSSSSSLRLSPICEWVSLWELGDDGSDVMCSAHNKLEQWQTAQTKSQPMCIANVRRYRVICHGLGAWHNTIAVRVHSRSSATVDWNGCVGDVWSQWRQMITINQIDDSLNKKMQTYNNHHYFLLSIADFFSLLLLLSPHHIPLL